MKTERQPPVEILVILLAAILFFLCMQGCKCPPVIASTDTVRITTIKEVPHDSTIYLTDSAGITALLECDSLGKVRIKQITDFYKGQFVKPTIVIKDNYVKVECLIDSAKVYLSWKERHETTTTTINTVKVDRQNYLTGWQWFQVWLGRIFMGLVVVYAGYQIIKRYTALKLPF